VDILNIEPVTVVIRDCTIVREMLENDGVIAFVLELLLEFLWVRKRRIQLDTATAEK
jgi:hypothetical protein